VRERIGVAAIKNVADESGIGAFLRRLIRVTFGNGLDLSLLAEAIPNGIPDVGRVVAERPDTFVCRSVEVGIVHEHLFRTKPPAQIDLIMSARRHEGGHGLHHRGARGDFVDRTLVVGSLVRVVGIVARSGLGRTTAIRRDRSSKT